MSNDIYNMVMASLESATMKIETAQSLLENEHEEALIPDLLVQSIFTQGFNQAMEIVRNKVSDLGYYELDCDGDVSSWSGPSVNVQLQASINIEDYVTDNIDLSEIEIADSIDHMEPEFVLESAQLMVKREQERQAELKRLKEEAEAERIKQEQEAAQSNDTPQAVS